MSALAQAVRELAVFDRRSAALLVLTPGGEYLVNPHGFGGGSESTFVISRAQLHDLMVAGSLRRDHLADADTAQRLARVVAEFYRRRTGQDLP